MYALSDLSIDSARARSLRQEQLVPRPVHVRERQPRRGHVLPQAVRLELRLDVPEQRRDVLLLGDPRALRRLLVRLEGLLVLQRVRVRADERLGGPDGLHVGHGAQERAHAPLVVVPARPDGLHELGELLDAPGDGLGLLYRDVSILLGNSEN